MTLYFFYSFLIVFCCCRCLHKCDSFCARVRHPQYQSHHRHRDRSSDCLLLFFFLLPNYVNDDDDDDDFFLFLNLSSILSFLWIPNSILLLLLFRRLETLSLQIIYIFLKTISLLFLRLERKHLGFVICGKKKYELGLKKEIMFRHIYFLAFSYCNGFLNAHGKKGLVFRMNCSFFNF